jgi:hypothetical protein
MEVPKDLLEKKGYCPEIGRKESTLYRERQTVSHFLTFSIMTLRFLDMVNISQYLSSNII